MCKLYFPTVNTKVISTVPPDNDYNDYSNNDTNNNT